MEQNFVDLLKDAFPETDFEQLDFDEDTATEASADVPQNEPDMKDDDNNHRESSGSESEFVSELANREGETKYCSENNVNFSEEQSMKTGSVLCGSWDDSDTDENKTQSHNQQLSLQDEECSENEFEIHTGVHQQAEDVSELERAPPTGACHDLETLRTSTEIMSGLLSYQMLDQPENESSSSEEDRVNTEKHSLDVEKLNRFSAIQSTSQVWPVESMNIQSEGDMKEFTEEDDEDHDREEEGLADYPPDLSQSDSGDSSEGLEEEQPNHMDTQKVACSYENLQETVLTYKCVTSREDGRVDHLDMIKDLNVETTSGKSDDDVLFQMKQDSCRDDTSSSEIPNIGESSEFGIFNDYDSDISSDGDDCEDQEEKPDLTSLTILKENNTALQEQEHTFTTDFSSDPDSIEREVRDVVLLDYPEVVEICGVEDLLRIPAFSGAGRGESLETENRNGSESHPSEDCSTKIENNSERLEVSDFGENINTLLPGMFWSETEEGNLKFDEFDWDINGNDEICDEVEELENDEEENERDWEKEKARIEAFNKYYEPVDGEENTGRSHKVTFSLEPECYLHYEEDTDSSEEDPELSSAKQDQNYDDNESLEFPQVSFTAEDISASLISDDNLKVDEYEYDNNEDELYKVDANKVCKDEDDFSEKLKMKIEQLEQEKIEARKYIQESKEELHEATNRTHKTLFQLHQEFSQNEEDNDSSEQDSNTEDDTRKSLKAEDQSDSDELCERRLYTGRHKVLKSLQRADKQKKETPKRNTCVVLLRSVLAVSLASVVGLLSYCWATDGLDWIN